MKEIDAETLMDAAWSLSYLSRGGDSVLELLILSGVIPHLIRHLR